MSLNAILNQSSVLIYPPVPNPFATRRVLLLPALHALDACSTRSGRSPRPRPSVAGPRQGGAQEPKRLPSTRWLAPSGAHSNPSAVGTSGTSRAVGRKTLSLTKPSPIKTPLSQHCGGEARSRRQPLHRLLPGAGGRDPYLGDSRGGVRPLRRALRAAGGVRRRHVGHPKGTGPQTVSHERGGRPATRRRHIITRACIANCGPRAHPFPPTTCGSRRWCCSTISCCLRATVTSTICRRSHASDEGLRAHEVIGRRFQHLSRGWRRTRRHARHAGPSPVTSAFRAEDGWGCPATGPAWETAASVTGPRESISCSPDRRRRSAIHRSPARRTARRLAVSTAAARRRTPGNGAIATIVQTWRSLLFSTKQGSELSSWPRGPEAMIAHSRTW